MYQLQAVSAEMLSASITETVVAICHRSSVESDTLPLVTAALVSPISSALFSEQSKSSPTLEETITTLQREVDLIAESSKTESVDLLRLEDIDKQLHSLISMERQRVAELEEQELQIVAAALMLTCA